jgi:predicted hydrocarbon binding protein/KaiC/GvpD/RAD55 family RecA-like ATPase
MVSLSEIQEIPTGSTILLVGPPGAGKSAFCEQVILTALAVSRPIIYVTTECSPSRAEETLRERGLGEIKPSLLSFVDAYDQTVGLTVADRPDTVPADCADLSSMGVAIFKLQERMGKKGILLVFDSLTSPYLLSGSEVVRFLRLTLSRFTAEGNRVLACFDEGSGKEEDLVAMMSLSNGIIKMARGEDRQMLSVVKHPEMKPSNIEIAATERIEKLHDPSIWDLEFMKRWLKSQESLRELAQRCSANVFWPNFAFWSAMPWDSRRFPTMTYDVWRNFGTLLRDMMPLLPWHMRFLWRSMMPKRIGEVKGARKFFEGRMGRRHFEMRGDGILDYREEVSRNDEHTIRVYESRECSGFESIGASMAYILPSLLAGSFQAIESIGGSEREWNAIETKCIGLGDPYCELKLVAGEIPELRGSLEKDGGVVARIQHHMIHRAVEFLVHGKPLVERPRLGSNFVMGHPEISLPALSSERYRIALRMGGAKSGREVGEHLMDEGLTRDEAAQRAVNFLEHCGVGKVRAHQDTMIIEDSRESIYSRILTAKWEEPSCYFSTGFLNGFFSAVRGQQVREVKCMAMGDPYCEWEFR